MSKKAKRLPANIRGKPFAILGTAAAYGLGLEVVVVVVLLLELGGVDVVVV